MPEDKVEAMKKLRTETKMAMIGDDVNDAPAMANAALANTVPLPFQCCSAQ